MKTILASLLTLIGLGACAQNPGYKSLDADEFQKAIEDKSVVLIDVRTSAEYAQGHIPDAALNIDVLEGNFAAKVKSALDKSTTLAIYCRSGRRSKNAAEILTKEGYKVIELAGGFNSWTSAGKPTTCNTPAD